MVANAMVSVRTEPMPNRRRSHQARPNTSGQTRKTWPWMDSDQKCWNGEAKPPSRA